MATIKPPRGSKPEPSEEPFWYKDGWILYNHKHRKWDTVTRKPSPAEVLQDNPYWPQEYCHLTRTPYELTNPISGKVSIAERLRSLELGPSRIIRQRSEPGAEPQSEEAPPIAVKEEPNSKEESEAAEYQAAQDTKESTEQPETVASDEDPPPPEDLDSEPEGPPGPPGPLGPPGNPKPPGPPTPTRTTINRSTNRKPEPYVTQVERTSTVQRR